MKERRNDPGRHDYFLLELAPERTIGTATKGSPVATDAERVVCQRVYGGPGPLATPAVTNLKTRPRQMMVATLHATAHIKIGTRHLGN